jgi:hypothetical protein
MGLEAGLDAASDRETQRATWPARWRGSLAKRAGIVKEGRCGYPIGM